MKATEADRRAAEQIDEDCTYVIAGVGRVEGASCALAIAEAMRPEREAAKELCRLMEAVIHYFRYDRICNMDKHKAAVKAYKEATK